MKIYEMRNIVDESAHLLRYCEHCQEEIYVCNDDWCITLMNYDCKEFEYKLEKEEVLKYCRKCFSDYCLTCFSEHSCENEEPYEYMIIR